MTTTERTESTCRYCREPIRRYCRVLGEEPKWWHPSGMRHCTSRDPTDTRVAEPIESEEPTT